MIPGVRPRRAQWAAIQLAMGVLPVPPTLRLPTAMVGTPTPQLRSRPCRYARARTRAQAAGAAAAGTSEARARRAEVVVADQSQWTAPWALIGRPPGEQSARGAPATGMAAGPRPGGTAPGPPRRRERIRPSSATPPPRVDEPRSVR